MATTTSPRACSSVTRVNATGRPRLHGRAQTNDMWWTNITVDRLGACGPSQSRGGSITSTPWCARPPQAPRRAARSHQRRSRQARYASAGYSRSVHHRRHAARPGRIARQWQRRQPTQSHCRIAAHARREETPFLRLPHHRRDRRTRRALSRPHLRLHIQRASTLGRPRARLLLQLVRAFPAFQLPQTPRVTAPSPTSNFFSPKSPPWASTSSTCRPSTP